MEQVIIPVLGIIGAVMLPVIFTFVILSIYFKNRAKERLAMIDKGIIPEEIAKPEKKSNRYPALRNGLLLIGISLGIIFGVVLGPVIVVGDWMDLTIFTMAVLFGGIAFVVYFFLARAMELKEREQDKDINI